MKFIKGNFRNNKNKLFSVLIIVLMLLINVVVNLYFSIDISNSPDATGQELFIEQIAGNGFLPINNYASLNLEYKNVFAPRGTVVNKYGDVLPLKAPFTSFIYGSFYVFLKQIMNIGQLLLIYNEIVLFILILYFYKFWLSFGYKNNYLILLLVVLILLLSGLDNFIDIYSVFIFISLYYLKIWLDHGTKKLESNLIISSILISIVVLIRNELIILFIPIFLFFVYLFFVKKFNLNIFLFFVGPILAICTILYTNKVYYGGYLTFGYSLDSKSRATINTSGAVKQGGLHFLGTIQRLLLLYGFQPLYIAQNFYYYVLALFYYLFLPAVINIKDIKNNKLFILLFSSIAVYILIYYGSNNTFYGNGAITINSSYVRYFYPIYLILILYALSTYNKVITSLLNSKKAGIFIFTGIILLLMSYKYQNISDNYEHQLGYLNLLNATKETIPSGSILFANYWDKLYYKDYQVATLSRQLNSENDYFTIMEQYYLDNPKQNVYFVPQDIAEKTLLKKYISNNKKITCNDINILFICKVTKV